METHTFSEYKKTSEPGYEVIYVESLDKKEKKAYLIAKSHLGSSFDLKKSVGFLNWVKSQNQPASVISKPT
jgi:hypothetical protein